MSTKKMLINATRPEAIRGVIIDETGKLDAYELEVADAGLQRGNIYVGTVANVEASLNAAFIDYGATKQGFLPVADVCEAAYHQEPRSSGRVRIEEVLRRRRRILVQVVKDAIGNKGAALTTEVALAGRFAVLTPRDSADGVSRKIEDDDERKRLRAIIDDLKLPEGYGVIARTSALGRSAEDIKRDVESMLDLWRSIEKRAKERRTKTGTCLYEDNDLVIRMLRDQYATDIGEVWVDTRAAYDAAREYFQRNMPKLTQVVQLWDRPDGLFSHFQIESQIQAVYERRVELPSGGSIIIEPTEALTVVDVNSGRSTSGSSQAETAYSTNLEAADEIGRQLRLRDLGGLVVVDFIDMSTGRHRRAVEKQMKLALKRDRARTYVGTISENGLLEINRQRIKQALRLQTHQTCPTCGGNGVVRGSDYAALSVLRRIEERAVKGDVKEVTIGLPPDLANTLQNRHRRELSRLEEQWDLSIVVRGNPELNLSDERFSWTKRTAEEMANASFAASEASEARAASSASQPKVETTEARPAGGTDDKDTESKPSGRSRRRRRRRRRSRGSSKASASSAPKTDAQEPQTAAAPGDEKAADKAPADPADGGKDDATSRDDGDSASPQGSRRSRSRRSRRSKSSDKPAANSSETPAPDDSAAAEAKEPESGRRPRRSRRRRSNRPTAEEPGRTTPVPTGD